MADTVRWQSDPNLSPAEREQQYEREQLELLATKLPVLQAQLAQRQTQKEQMEAADAAAAKTPLALELRIVSCRWAQEQYDGEHDMPTITFPTIPCPFGKKTTDQDCRDCQFVKLLPYGHELPYHEKRYHGHGMVIPIPDEETSQKLGEALRDLGLKPLKRVEHEIHALEKAIGEAEVRQKELESRALERQQRGQF